MIRFHRAALVALALPLAACSREARGEAAAPVDRVPVSLAPVTEEHVAPPVEGTGVLAPKDQLELGFKIGGVVARVLVAEGEVVRRGQQLATLDLREIDASVGRARSGLAKAERDLARARALYADSVATLQQLQDAQTGAEVARNDAAAAAFNRRYAAILAPAAGTVLRRLVEPGEVVGAGAPVLVLGGAERGQVLRLGLADRDVVRLRAGDAATVRFDAYPGVDFAGRVGLVAPAADPRTGTYQVEIAVDPAGRVLPTGLVGRAEVRPREGRAMRTVPIEAVLEADGEHATVYTVAADGRTARRVPVRVGAIRGSRVAVSEGLDGVARVVTRGAAYLGDGVPVEVVP